MSTAGTQKVLEMVVFKLKDGVTRQEWLDAIEPAIRWAEKLPGYISGELFYDESKDRWIDVVYFESAELAEAHLKMAPTEPVNAAMFGCIDMATPEVYYADLVSSNTSHAGSK